MGLDIQMPSVPRTMSTLAVNGNIGSQYSFNPRPRWQQVDYSRGDWDTLGVLASLYASRGGKGDFNNRSVRIYKRDLQTLPSYWHTSIQKHLNKGRVVYAEVSF